MKRTTLLLLVAGLALTGCGDSFPDEEMHLGNQNKTRPLGVLVEPPDAAPGDTVTVTLLARSPAPDDLDITWRVAQDFDNGLYEADEVERDFRDLAPAPAVADADGFLSQSFTWVVPDSVLLNTTAIPAVLSDPLMAGLAEYVVGSLRKADVAAYLADLTPADLAAMDPDRREAALGLADVFACQVRFRARLHDDRIIDVTRNLTVRHSRRLGSANLNRNAAVTELAVVALELEDGRRRHIGDPAVAQTTYPFITGGVRVAGTVQVPYRAGWTYYLVTAFAPEQYMSPFTYGQLLGEEGSYRWYYYRQDAPRSDNPFFRTEDGKDAEMWNLKEEARVQPPVAGARYRIVAAVRDERGEWKRYHAVPGLGVAEGVVEFVEPGS